MRLSDAASDAVLFARFTGDRLGGAAFVPHAEREEDRIFHASLQSTRALVGFAQGARNPQGHVLQVIPGFLDRMDPNAIADRSEGVHFLAFNQALLVTVVEFALFVFTQRDCFPGIGNAKGEISPGYAGDHAPGLLLLERTLRGQAVETSTDAVRVPRDAERHVAAVYLALLMARFVWFHELAHCVNGHVVLVQDYGIAPRLHEVEPALSVTFAADPEVSCRTGRLLRLLEFDADESALRACLRIQFDGQENIGGIAAINLDTRIELTLFAAHAMTWLFEEYRNFTRAFRGETHPDPFQRLLSIGQAITAFEREQRSLALRDASDRVGLSFRALKQTIPAIHRLEAVPVANAGPSASERDLLALDLAALRFESNQ
jgi:hypothetical protein